MLHLQKLRQLDLQAPGGAGRPAHLSAASGLVRVGARLYVIADDEHQLAHFSMDRAEPGQLIRLIPGELPDAKSERKALKPDFEALSRLPDFAGYPDGALFALGSGSTSRRQTGVLLRLDGQGAVQDAPRTINLEPTFCVIREQLGEINIEGAFVTGDRLLLLQRGNTRSGRNACIELSLSAVLQALGSADSLDGVKPLGVQDFNLGEIADVPLSFSDGAALPNGGWVFTAIAEDTDNSYADGRCVGAAVGLVRANGQLGWIRTLSGPHKVEGIEASIEGGAVRLLLVTDADDASIPASLLTVTIEG